MFLLLLFFNYQKGKEIFFRAVFLPWGCCNEVGGLDQKTFIVSQFWLLEVQTQDVCRVMFPLNMQGRVPPYLSLASGDGISPWLHSFACRCITDLCLHLHMVFSLSLLSYTEFPL